jgi:hypothetical protein
MSRIVLITGDFRDLPFTIEGNHEGKWGKMRNSREMKTEARPLMAGLNGLMPTILHMESTYKVGFRDLFYAHKYFGKKPRHAMKRVKTRGGYVSTKTCSNRFILISLIYQAFPA